LANVVEIPAIYALRFFGLEDLAENPVIKVSLGIVFIAIMTYISYRGIVISERIQAILVSFQFIVLIVMSIIALVRVYGGSAGPQAVHTTWHFFMRGLFPLLGGIGMAAAFIKSAIDMVNPDYGFTTFGTIGGVFVIGVGMLALGVPLMIACAVRLRAFSAVRHSTRKPRSWCQKPATCRRHSASNSRDQLPINGLPDGCTWPALVTEAAVPDP
jgi:amino acid transporter